MERCPNCRARVQDSPVACRRCGMDLGLLLAVEAAAADRLQRALARLAVGDETAARAELRQSLGLRRDPLAARLLSFLAAEAAARAAEFASAPIPAPPEDWYLT